jgi:DNA-binding NarL/FixJ family response regulator
MSTTRVLVCDDHAVLADGLAAVLDREPDLEILPVVGSVEAAVDALAGGPDVVLMDYELADGNGVDATRRIKEARPETAVVMLTSFTDEEVLLGAVEAGCSGFLTKHTPATEVVGAVRAAAAGEALISPAMLARLLPRLRSGQHRPGYDLTPRERTVLGLLARAATSEEMASELGISTNTVRNHVQNLLVKLGAHSRLEAVAIAMREGLLPRG